MIGTGLLHWLEIPDSPKDKFKVTLKTKDLKLLTFQSAADYTARVISSRYSDLHVALSGGLDSEFVAETLLRNKIPFTPVILKAKENLEDVRYALKWCEKNKTPAYIIDYEHRGEQLARELITLCYIHNFATEIGAIPVLLAQYIRGTLLTGSGEPAHFIELNDKKIALAQHDFYLNYAHGDWHPANFFSYTPQIFAAFVNEIDLNIDLQSAKAKLYGLENRPKFRTRFDLSKYGIIMDRFLKKFEDICFQFGTKEETLALLFK